MIIIPPYAPGNTTGKKIQVSGKFAVEAIVNALKQRDCGNTDDSANFIWVGTKTPAGGLIYSYASCDPNYPGIYTDYTNPNDIDISLTLVEHHPDEGLRTLTWENVLDEDYTRSANLSAADKLCYADGDVVLPEEQEGLHNERI